MGDPLLEGFSCCADYSNNDTGIARGESRVETSEIYFVSRMAGRHTENVRTNEVKLLSVRLYNYYSNTFIVSANLSSSNSRGLCRLDLVFRIKHRSFGISTGEISMATTTTVNYGETLADIEATIGLVPGFMEALPEEDLVHEWPTFKKYVLGESAIPPKYRELIGLAVAANIKCPYCQAFHQGTAQLHGATDEEFSEIAVLAGLTARWSSMVHAQHYNYETFMEEFEQIGSFLQPGYETRFKVLDSSQDSTEESAIVKVGDGTVTVTGTIVGNTACYTARLDGVTIEEGELVVRVESYDDREEDEMCPEVIIGIEYEAVVEFDDEVPASVRVEHNGEPVATGSQS